MTNDRYLLQTVAIDVILSLNFAATSAGTGGAVAGTGGAVAGTGGALVAQRVKGLLPRSSSRKQMGPWPRFDPCLTQVSVTGLPCTNERE